MKAFALSIYNPCSTPVAVDAGELKKMGFNLLITAKQEVSMEGAQKQVCSQPLPWGRGAKALEIFLKPMQGRINVHAESGLRDGLIPSDENFAGLGSIGTHVFDDGLVIAWVTKPVASTK